MNCVSSFYTKGQKGRGRFGVCAAIPLLACHGCSMLFDAVHGDGSMTSLRRACPRRAAFQGVESLRART